ncbi:Helix-turn-helix domain-containing protein [Amycolatopsis marina]|uniref:Helix-turn-helix domain-containing protein n=3 Tax=Amycolatopsis TaxID=1813 RepID=A0A1I1CPX9_9PSEU|nr:helix-turn-helix protein [Prauserella muralis]SDU62829.1 Helix-turn-helix domain-containing protein [Amycolatopsis keratiniphila]SFB64594.1 Helix-turn-helix domain-containing protein [Amycolatopsis marina]
MRGMTDDLTIGERVAFYRQRRGLTQAVLAGLVGRSEDWLRKVEHDVLPLDRLSVLRRLAHALDVALGDVIGEPVLMAGADESGRRTIPALRVALMDHRQFLAGPQPGEPPRLDALAAELATQWGDYQNSRYARLIQRLPLLITETQTACQHYGHTSDDGVRAHTLAASAHQLATAFLTKLGEADLASISASRGLAAAHVSGSDLMIGSLYRSVAHALLSIGEFEQAVALSRAAADRLEPGLGTATPEYLSVYGMLHLVGAVASSRRDNRADTTAFLAEADQAATRVGHDANHLWTAFGPTNVTIHRMTTAMELGDVQVAVHLGPRVNTHGLPVERQARHAIETARAYVRWNRTDDALDVLLAAEQDAPEQVRYHRLSRILVREMIRLPRPATRAVELAYRMGVHAADSHRP